jgi:DNA-directed RNA polymerase subunit omega
MGEMTVQDYTNEEINKAIKKAGSEALIINLVAKRVRQLQRGARPLVQKAGGLTSDCIAIKEFLEGKIGFRFRENPGSTSSNEA